MDVSVIIPTYNRRDLLYECVRKLLEQDFKQQYEIIIVDDGSDVGYGLPIELEQNKKVVYVKKDHAGPAAARNYGVRIAQAKYVIFIGDDIICSSSFLSEHYRFLVNNSNCASAGSTVWHFDTPNKSLLSLLQYIGLGNFSTENKDDCGFYSFTTSNIAIPKAYLELEKFDEKFPYPALEDNELGLRLYKRGLKIKYNEKAIAYHKHAYTMDVLKKRQRELGYSIGYFIKKYPEMKAMFVKCNIYYLLAGFLRLRIFYFMKFYNKVAICMFEKYKGIKKFKKC
ncbi:MAG: glycosyltransferase [Candidatus Omnitrophica bacterium]|nr:glycosyltransferase [Candidatus Omnitrophota bacterium]